MRIRIAGAAALLALAGCEGGAPAPDGDAVANEAAAAANGTDAGASSVDPAASAALLPDYPGADQVRDGRGTGGGASLAFRSRDAPRRIVEFYADVARRAGLAAEISPPDGVMMVSLRATDGEGGLVSLTATRVGDVTEVQAMAAVGAGR